jgi:Ca2+-binding EF-hand superfamily protein
MKIYRTLAIVVVVGAASSSPALARQAGERSRPEQTRLRSMDADRDGVITRTEWRGSVQAFRQQDRNRDGVLSGGEIRGVLAQDGVQSDDDSRRRRIEANATRVLAMDADKDGVVTRAEWRDDVQGFRQQDTNRDGVLSGDEVRAVAFQDGDKDGVITRGEWRGDVQAFRAQDKNGDGVLSGTEAQALLNPPETAEETRIREAMIAQFNGVDRNRDGRIARDEWNGHPRAFSRMDANRDGLVTRVEFATASAERPEATSGERRPTPSYQAGYDKGVAEGRVAGKEDRNRAGSPWDLDGQRELERADSGYEARIGPREEYQAGYRAGFSRGYTEGYGPRR